MLWRSQEKYAKGSVLGTGKPAPGAEAFLRDSGRRPAEAGALICSLDSIYWASPLHRTGPEHTEDTNRQMLGAAAGKLATQEATQL